MRQRELERRLIEWQSALGLLDWEIEVALCSKESMPDDLGEVEYSVTDRTAQINIRAGEPKQELTLVHELLHLHFRTLLEARGNLVVEEQAIEAVSKCLVGLKARKCAA